MTLYNQADNRLKGFDMSLAKKFSSIFLSIVLVAGLLPYSAYADPAASSTEVSSTAQNNEAVQYEDDGIAAYPGDDDFALGSGEEGAGEGTEVVYWGEDSAGSASSRDASSQSDADQDANSQSAYAEGKLAIWAAGLDGAPVEDVYPTDANQVESYANGVGLTPMSFSEEMTYFCKYESSCNYDQGLSSGDGYHAMGYFQFDNRYGLGGFLEAVYNYNPSKYSALKQIGDIYGWDVYGNDGSTNYYKDGRSYSLREDLNWSWHQAYAADPAEFSELQNGWAYTEYYSGSLGAKGILGALGINLDNRPDCIKGLCWGMVNLFGAGGGVSYINEGKYYGASWFFKNSGINDSMTNKELVTTLCDYVVDNVASRYSSQPEYHQGWQNRYKNEKSDCLSYLAASNLQDSKTNSGQAPSPQNVKAQPAGDGEVALTWDAVDGADAYAIAEYRDGSYLTYTLSCASTSYTVSDLSAGREHRFLVQAHVGGSWSACSTGLLVGATPTGVSKPSPTAAAGDGSITLSWAGVPGASSYAVATRNADGSYRTYTLSCESTSYTVSGLANGTAYQCLVQAKVDGVWSAFSDADLVSCAPVDPKSPQNVKAQPAGDGEVALTWDAVDGADAYAIAEYRDGSYLTYTLSCASTSYTVSDLSAGREHRFLVQAHVGGSWSACSTGLLVGATPTGSVRPEPTAVGGDGSATITWAKVPGATKYAVSREGAVAAAITFDTSYTANGLTNGVSYGYRVRAFVDGVWTDSVDDVVWVTPGDVRAPQVVVVADGSSVKLSWQPISGAGKYAVALKTGSSYKTYTYDCENSFYTIEDLEPGTYQLLVQANVNGDWSRFTDANLVSVTVHDKNAPVVQVDSYSSSSVDISWEAVPGATKYAIAEYVNGTYRNFSLNCTSTTFTVGDLQKGQRHYYLVQAYVDGRWSKFSDSDYVMAMLPDESSPEVTAVVSGDGEVTLLWNPVSGATAYAVAEYKNGDYSTFTTTCDGNSYKVTNLGNGHVHKFLVQAKVNGVWSAASTDLLVAATPHGTMSPMATATAGDLSATVSWTSVPGATRYAVAAQNGDGSFTTYTYDATGTSYTVKGLVSGRAYRMLVQAYVDGQWSPFSSIDLVSVTPYGVNVPEGQQMMTDIANNGFSSSTSYLILVNLSRHEVGVFVGGYNNWKCDKFWSCVTGAPSTPTITGTYSTTGFKRTNLTTDTRARWATQINGGYFFHSILNSDSELGTSASHGCIRLSVDNAKWIYDNIFSGTKVFIY